MKNIDDQPVTIGALRQLLGELEERFDIKMEARFAKQEKSIDARFTEQNKRIDTRFTQQEKQIEHRFTKQEVYFHQLLRDEFGKVHKRLDQLLETEGEDVRAVADDVVKLDLRVTVLERAR